MTIYDQDISFYIGENKLFPITVIDEDTGLYKNLTGASILWEVLNRNTGESLITKTTASGISINNPTGGQFTVILEASDTSNFLPANYYYHRAIVTDNLGAISVVTVGNVILDGVKVSNIGYLIPYLRLTMGDTNPTNYRYLDHWLHIALIASVKTLQAWWLDKYLINDSNNIYRNTTTGIPFEQAEPPTILQRDERPIVLMAAIIILEGSLENSAWSISSWKDAEISFSNLESGRIRDSNLERLWNELNGLIKPPTKRLARTLKGSLPGYLNNEWEVGDLS